MSVDALVLGLKCSWCGAAASWWYRGRTGAGWACRPCQLRYAGMPYTYRLISELRDLGVLDEARELVEHPRCRTCTQRTTAEAEASALRTVLEGLHNPGHGTPQLGCAICEALDPQGYGALLKERSEPSHGRN